MIKKFGEKRDQTKYIIIHHFGVTTSYFGNAKIEKQAVLNAFDKHPEYTYHYVILSDGSIVSKYSDDIVIYHANNNEVNNTSIAICVFGNFEKQNPTKSQIETLKALVKKCVEKYHIDPKNILGHKDVGDSFTECPGQNLYSLLPEIRNLKGGNIMDWKQELLNWAVQKGLIKNPEQHKNLDGYFTKAEILAILKNILEKSNVNIGG